MPDALEKAGWCEGQRATPLAVELAYVKPRKGSVGWILRLWKLTPRYHCPQCRREVRPTRVRGLTPKHRGFATLPLDLGLLSYG